MRFQVVVLTVAVAGCVDTSVERVKLTAQVQSASIAVESNALVSQLSGDFVLSLERGDLSESSATVEEAPALTLLDGTGAQLASLDAVPAPAAPWTVLPDETEEITFTLSDENVLEQSARDAVCEAGTVVIHGLLKPVDADDLTFESAPITPSGCE
jgi:hypothetical protein